MSSRFDGGRSRPPASPAVVTTGVVGYCVATWHSRTNCASRVAAALIPGSPWAVDNAAFSGFDPVAFCALLAKVARVPGCRFVACPDVVADAVRTARLFEVWHPVIKALGLPVALVGQDGIEELSVPWERMDALFVGGSTEWKTGPAALVRAAKERGLWVHMGRVNTRSRFRHAFHLGCDSVDGSGFSKWPDQRIPVALRWMADLHGDPAPERSATTGRSPTKSSGTPMGSGGPARGGVSRPASG